MMTEIDAPISALADDLELKFKDLCLIYECPELFLSEYFSELKNQIDINAEQKLQELGANDLNQPESPQASAEEVVKLNSLRNAFIRILDERREELMNRLPVPAAITSNRVYTALGTKIERFRKSLKEDGNIDEKNEAYISLAREIFDKSSQLEAQLFHNQTIGYVKTKRKLGQLIYVQTRHLNLIELEALK